MAAKANKRVLPPHVSLDPEKQKEFNQVAQQAKKKAAQGTAGPGVIYVAHLPHGFVEQPLRDFFKQFGTIRKLRLSRSKKTGNSKGYAFIQFTHVEVAKIAAETMNNYLMFNKLLKCSYLENPHPAIFKNADRIFSKPKGPLKAIRQRNAPRSEEAVLNGVKKAKQKLNKKLKKLAELGIDYSLEVQGSPVKVKDELFSDEAESNESSEDEMDTQMKEIEHKAVNKTKSKPDTPKSAQKPAGIAKIKPDTPKSAQKPASIEKSKPDTPKSAQKPVSIANSKPDTPKSAQKPVSIANSKPDTPKSAQKPVSIANSKSDTPKSAQKPVGLAKSKPDTLKSAQKHVGIAQGKPDTPKSAQKHVGIAQSKPDTPKSAQKPSKPDTPKSAQKPVGIAQSKPETPKSAQKPSKPDTPKSAQKPVGIEKSKPKTPKSTKKVDHKSDNMDSKVEVEIKPDVPEPSPKKAQPKLRATPRRQSIIQKDSVSTPQSSRKKGSIATPVAVAKLKEEAADVEGSPRRSTRIRRASILDTPVKTEEAGSTPVKRGLKDTPGRQTVKKLKI